MKTRIHWDYFLNLHSRPSLLLKKVNDGSIVTRFDKTPVPQNASDVVCPHFVELKWAYGCPFDCSWCYLKGTFRFKPDGLKPVFKDRDKVKNKAPSPLKRIEAAKRLYEKGYPIRLRKDPIVPINDWQEQYQQLIDDIFDKFIPERLTFGSLRGLQSTINGTEDKSWTGYLREYSNWGKKVDLETRYDLYSFLINYLKKQHQYNHIALCKESIEVWDKLGMDWKNIRCNCLL